MMFNNIEALYEFLFNRRSTYKQDKTGFQRWMKVLGDPYLKLKCIHVAGTNGKGSTTNYIRSILQTAGYKVGSFTSPHLIKHNDRIRINDVSISDEELLAYGNQYVDTWLAYDLSIFEIDMFISIDYFLKNHVDFVVYEVGLGGRLDTTNIIQPYASVITNIGYDHMDLLGDTLDAISFEKAGIIKSHKPLFTTEDKTICLDVFRKKCDQQQSEMHQVTIPQAQLVDNHVQFQYGANDYRLKTSALYQTGNAVLALAVCQWLNQVGIAKVSVAQMQQALAETTWAGRFEPISQQPLVIVDGAHNEMGIRQLAHEIKHLPQPCYIIFSALKDKAYSDMIDLLLPVAGEMIVTAFDFYRAQSAEALAQGKPVTVKADFQQAYQYALELNQKTGGSIVITGSLYFISQVLESLKGV